MQDQNEKDSFPKDTKSADTRRGPGGAQPGAGRPRGQTNRLTAREILETAGSMLGRPFVVSLLEGYIETINSDDRRNRAVYEKMILDKVATTIVEAEITDTSESVAAKTAAFAEALAALTGVRNEK
jgi:hypothetical protein